MLELECVACVHAKSNAPLHMSHIHKRGMRNVPHVICAMSKERGDGNVNGNVACVLCESDGADSFGCVYRQC